MPMSDPRRVALYARCSTAEQHTSNQIFELRRYAESRGWTAQEFVDEAVSGAKESRPALDALMKAARRRRFDAIVVFRLDRLGRSLRHLIMLLDELQALGVAFVSRAEGLDCTTPAGKLQLHVLGAIAEFERGRIRERVMAGLQRARREGKRIGRPRKAGSSIAIPGGSVRAAAAAWGVSKSTAARWIAAGRVGQPSAQPATLSPSVSQQTAASAATFGA
jgi:DNA invertase Pin-like site-specific DNA recombinase